MSKEQAPAPKAPAYDPEVKKKLQAQLDQLQSKAYTFVEMKSQVESQLNVFINQISQVRKLIQQEDAKEKESKGGTAASVPTAAGTNQPSPKSNDPKPAGDGAAPKGKGKPAGNKAKGNSK